MLLGFFYLGSTISRHISFMTQPPPLTNLSPPSSQHSQCAAISLLSVQSQLLSLTVPALLRNLFFFFNHTVYMFSITMQFVCIVWAGEETIKCTTVCSSSNNFRISWQVQITSTVLLQVTFCLRNSLRHHTHPVLSWIK